MVIKENEIRKIIIIIIIEGSRINVVLIHHYYENI